MADTVDHQTAYWIFYLEGRGAERTRNLRIDIAELAASLAAESPLRLHELVRLACEKAYIARETERKKREWMEDNEEELDGLVDAVHAYKMYCAGRIDSLAEVTEQELLDEMDSKLG